jgi:protein arginine N-methyltransferase 1
MPSELINVEHPFYNSPSVHLAMLKDDVRVIAFRNALEQLIKPNETTVLEIGTGTGILSLIAASLGAKNVFATEAANGMIETSRESFLKNAIGNNIKLIPIDSSNSEVLPENVDIIVSECLGHFAFDENMVRVIAESKSLLNKNGHFIPRRIRLVVATTSSSDIFSLYIEPWGHTLFSFNFSHIKKKAIEQIYIKTFLPSDINSEENQIIDYFVGDSTDYLNGRTKIAIKSDGLVYGLVGWFEAELAEGIWLSTSPLLPTTHWEQVFLPFQEPLTVKAGTELNVNLEIASDSTDNKVNFFWEWQDNTGSGNKLSAII